MAKRKPAPEPVPARSAPPPPSAASIPILSLKGSREWGEWFAELARESRTTKAGLIDRLTAEHAKEIGFRSPPER
jgi:hypothetical protein